MGRRGPAAKSTAEKKARGTYRKGRDPKAAAAAPPIVEPPSETTPALPPPPPAIPDPPEGPLGPIALREWARTAPRLAAQGLLEEDDRDALACYCQAFERWTLAEQALRRHGMVFGVGGGPAGGAAEGDDGEAAPPTGASGPGYAQQRPEVAIANKAMELMRRFQAEFGMTPLARGRVPRGGAQKAAGTPFGSL